jgi:hypothetical protein
MQKLKSMLIWDFEWFDFEFFGDLELGEICKALSQIRVLQTLNLRGDAPIYTLHFHINVGTNISNRQFDTILHTLIKTQLPTKNIECSRNIDV